MQSHLRGALLNCALSCGEIGNLKLSSMLTALCTAPNLVSISSCWMFTWDQNKPIHNIYGTIYTTCETCHWVENVSNHSGRGLSSYYTVCTVYVFVYMYGFTCTCTITQVRTRSCGRFLFLFLHCKVINKHTCTICSIIKYYIILSSRLPPTRLHKFVVNRSIYYFNLRSCSLHWWLTRLKTLMSFMKACVSLSSPEIASTSGSISPKNSSNFESTFDIWYVYKYQWSMICIQYIFTLIMYTILCTSRYMCLIMHAGCRGMNTALSTCSYVNSVCTCTLTKFHVHVPVFPSG